jgi:hypothetical protein
MIFSAESAGADGFDFDRGGLCVRGRALGFTGSGDVDGAFALLAMARGAGSRVEEIVKRPIPMPITSAMIAMASGRVKRGMESI